MGIVKGAVEMETDTAYDFPRGDFTWLVEVSMSCNACGHGSAPDLFKPEPPLDASYKLAILTNNLNECICPGPDRKTFLDLFQRMFELQISDVTVINVTEVPIIPVDQCYPADEQTSMTTYNYTGVCLGRKFEQYLERVFEAPSGSPTGGPTSLPTDEPTDSPTDGPTSEPTNEPTAFPTEAPVTTPRPTFAPVASPTDSPVAAPTDAPVVLQLTTLAKYLRLMRPLFHLLMLPLFLRQRRR